jgi:hypothetical protein
VPAWGQAAPKEGGVVTDPIVMAGELAHEGGVQISGGGYRPSTRVNGPEWVN